MKPRLSPEQRRKKDLASIHASVNQLGLDDDTYRDLLQSVTGVRSAKALDQAARHAVIARLRDLAGARSPRPAIGTHPGTPRNMHVRPMLTKIEQQLTAMQLPWAYADSIARHMFRVERVAWLKKQEQLQSVIAALDAEHERRTLRAGIEKRLAELGMSEDEMIRQLRPPKTWRSNRKVLALIRDTLEASVEMIHEQATAKGDA